MKKYTLLFITLLLYAISNAQDIPKKLKIGYNDKFNDVIIYTHRNVAYHSWVPIAAQIKVDNKTKEVALLIKLYYSGNSWVFFDEYLIKYTNSDNAEVTFSIPFDKGHKSDEVIAGGVIETVKLIPNDDLILSIKKFAESNNGMIRFQGKRHHNIKADKLFIKPLLETILMYESMKN